MDSKAAWKSKKRVSEITNTMFNTEMHRKAYLKERSEEYRRPETVRFRYKQIAVQPIHINRTVKELDKADYLQKLEFSCYKIFGLMVQDLTGINFIFEDEVEHIETVLSNIEKINFFTFRNIEVTREEFLKIAKFELFKLEDFRSFETCFEKYLKDCNFSEEDLEEVKEYYEVSFARIKSCSTKEKNYEINDYTSYNHLMENVNALQGLVVEPVSQ